MMRNLLMPLGQIAGIAAGYPLRSSAEELDPGDVSLVQLKNVSPERDILWDDVAKITLPSKREPTWLTANDIIFSSRGTKTLAYALPGVPPRAVCAPQFFVLTVKDVRRLLPEFLAWQINQKPAQDHFQREATGSYIQNIRKLVLEQLPIVVPPLHEQRLIVEFWCAARRERVILRQLIETTEAQLEAIAIGLAQHSGGGKQ